MGSYQRFPHRVVVLCLASSIWISLLPAASRTISGSDGLTVTVESSGAYNITVRNPAWRFAGKVGYPVANIYAESGSDVLGPYNEVSFDFQSDAPRHAAIRAYFNQKSVLFSVTTPSGAPNTFSFPAFAQYPGGVTHIAYDGMFGYPTFYAYAEGSPWIFFDSDANTFVVSSVTHSMVASSTWGPGGELSSGISTKIAQLPPGFTHQTVLVIDSGINRAFETWGHTLTDLNGKTRPANDADTSLNLLGYWTDAGSTYYYSMESPLSYPGTLAAVKAGFDRAGISLGYLQLDSWFYPKGAGADWTARGAGIYQYFAATPLFASTLANFQRTLAAPLVTHARWIDSASPYRKQYRMSGNVSTDPLYWGDVARYLSASGVTTYEQDWLSNQAQTDFNLTDPDLFLDNMADAMGQQNMTMQYCMPTTRHFLQGAKYSNLTSIRVSEDRFDQSRWRSFLYASRLASALGIWPFTDVLMSAETDNLLLATLSAGPVGIGDRLGTLNIANLLRAVRPDGVIVKPDVPLTPVDSSFLSDSHNLLAPLLASTYSDFGGLKAYYLFAFPQGPNTQAVFQLSDLGMRLPAYLYDYSDGTGRVVNPAEVLNETIANGWMYQVAAPIGPSGMALLGDTGQFVTLGKKRVMSLTDDGALQFSIAFAKGETSRTIEGYSPEAPTATALAGGIGRLSYDPIAHRFTIPVVPGTDGTVSVRIVRAAETLVPGPVQHHPRRPPVGLASGK